MRKIDELERDADLYMISLMKNPVEELSSQIAVLEFSNCIKTILETENPQAAACMTPKRETLFRVRGNLVEDSVLRNYMGTNAKEIHARSEAKLQEMCTATVEAVRASINEDGLQICKVIYGRSASVHISNRITESCTIYINGRIEEIK